MAHHILDFFFIPQDLSCLKLFYSAILVLHHQTLQISEKTCLKPTNSILKQQNYNEYDLVSANFESLRFCVDA